MWQSLDMTPDEVAKRYRDNIVYLGHIHDYPIYFHESTTSIRFNHPGAVRIDDDASADRYLAELEDVFKRLRELESARGHGAVWIRKAATMERKLGVTPPIVPPGLPHRHPAWGSNERHSIFLDDMGYRGTYFEEDNSWWLLGRTGFASTDYHYEFRNHSRDVRALTKFKLDLERRNHTPADIVTALSALAPARKS